MITDIPYDPYSIIFSYIDDAKTILDYKRSSKLCENIVCNTYIMHTVYYKEYTFNIKDGIFDLIKIGCHTTKISSCISRVEEDIIREYYRLTGKSIKISMISNEFNLYDKVLADIVVVYIYCKFGWGKLTNHNGIVLYVIENQDLKKFVNTNDFSDNEFIRVCSFSFEQKDKRRFGYKYYGQWYYRPKDILDKYINMFKKYKT